MLWPFRVFRGKLQKLDCSNNGLKTLPDTIGLLPNLTSLYGIHVLWLCGGRAAAVL